jgi:NADH-quinone oxidoreductase subunit M
LPDLNGRELATLVPLAVLVFWIGLNPGPFLDRVHASVEHLLLDFPAVQVDVSRPAS